MINKLEYNQFCKNLTGFNCYDYQLKVAELLLSGKNVILSVPTGAGKTWASILPFLYAKENNIETFPQKMIYSLPLRTLANSIYTDVSSTLEKKGFNKLTSIQTGEYKNDEHFEDDIIFSTIDQTLSNFLCFPLSLSRRQANINAGALIGSYLIFDEFHLLESNLSMATTLGILRAIKNLCRYCIMTATLSESYINELKNLLNAEVVKIDDFPDDVLKINSLKIPDGKSAKKFVKVVGETLTRDSILKLHAKKTIVICNRVEKAQQLYNDIIETDFNDFHNLSDLDKNNIVCLHSRFFDEDRKVKEKRLKELFGGKNTESAILISTQVIEAGMDISCDTMHVEISPINSFLQRAGRCARWETESGEIYVYDILDEDERELLRIETTNNKDEEDQIRAINNKYLPYDKELCEATFIELKETISLDKDSSQSLVDKILKDKELKDYSLISQSDFNRSKIQQSWEQCEKNMYSKTIRDIQNIEVAIIDYDLEKDRSFNPYTYQTISLYKWTFIKWVKKIFETRDSDIDDDVIFIPKDASENPIIDFDANDNDKYFLHAIHSIEPLKKCYDIVFVDKSIFKYTKGAGLEIGLGEICSPLKEYKSAEKNIVEYRKDTFEQHNKAIINCYEKEFMPKLKFLFNQLDEYWGETIDWDKLIKAMICLHDYGKLNTAWQIKMKKLQELKDNGNFYADEVLAHCDFNELTDKQIEIESGARNKPPHAGIGAYALVENSSDIIDADSFEDLANSVSTAILKHHGVDTNTYPDYDIIDRYYLHTDNLLKEINIYTQLKQKARGGQLTNSLPANIDEWIIYLFLVRILRLADQKATINIENYLNL